MQLPGAPATTLDQKRVLLNVPEPFPTLEAGLMGVVVVNGPEPDVLREVRVHAPPGFFNEAPTWWPGPALRDGLEPASSTIALLPDGAGFVFTPNSPSGEIALAPFDVVELPFRVQAVPDAVPPLPYADVDGKTVFRGIPKGTGRGAVAFANGHAETIFRGRSPGVFVVEVPPEQSALGLPGYPEGPAEATVTFDIGSRHVRTTVPYETVLLDPQVTLGLRDAVEASAVTTDPATVWLGAGGGSVTITADWSSLIPTLGQVSLGTVRDHLHVYAPYSAGQAPTWSSPSTAAGGLRHGVVRSAWGDVTGDGVADVALALETGAVVAVALTGHVLFTLEGDATNPVVDLAASGTGNLLVVYADGIVLERNGLTGVERRVNVGFQAASAEFGGLPLRFVVGGTSANAGAVKVVDVAAMTATAFAQQPENPVVAVGLAAAAAGVADPWAAAATVNGDVFVWDAIGTRIAVVREVATSPAGLSALYGLNPEVAAAVRVADVDGGAREVSIVTTWGRVLRVDHLGQTTSTARVPEEGIQAAAFVPDLTGDGVTDAAFAGLTGARLLDGRTLAQAWATPWPAYVQVPQGEVVDCLGTSGGRFSLGPCTTLGPPARRAIQVVGDGSRVLTLTLSAAGDLETTAFAADGAPAWGPTAPSWGRAEGGVLAAGSAPVLGALLAVGDSSGKLRLLDADDGLRVWEEDVAPLTGLFTYRFDLAPAAFLGSYIIEAELAWEQEDALGATFTETARILAVLDVHDENDLFPTYTVSLGAWQRDWKS